MRKILVMYVIYRTPERLTLSTVSRPLSTHSNIPMYTIRQQTKVFDIAPYNIKVHKYVICSEKLRESVWIKTHHKGSRCFQSKAMPIRPARATKPQLTAEREAPLELEVLEEEAAEVVPVELLLPVVVAVEEESPLKKRLGKFFL